MTLPTAIQREWASRMAALAPRSHYGSLDQGTDQVRPHLSVTVHRSRAATAAAPAPAPAATRAPSADALIYAKAWPSEVAPVFATAQPSARVAPSTSGLSAADAAIYARAWPSGSR